EAAGICRDLVVVTASITGGGDEKNAIGHHLLHDDGQRPGWGGFPTVAGHAHVHSTIPLHVLDVIKCLDHSTDAAQAGPGHELQGHDLARPVHAGDADGVIAD